MATVTVLVPRSVISRDSSWILNPPAVYQADRVTLSEQSGYFRAQLDCGLSVVIVPRMIQPELFEEILKFLSSKKIPEDNAMRSRLLSAAYLLDIPELAKTCSTALQDFTKKKFSEFQQALTEKIPGRSVDQVEAKAICEREPEACGEIAACDGPVKFERVLNPCARTINDPPPSRNVCPECQQEFKTFHCLEKHKMRHIIPVSSGNPEGKKNVKFYPCKQCGLKFPTYYFVQKHRKSCTGKGV